MNFTKQKRVLINTSVLTDDESILMYGHKGPDRRMNRVWLMPHDIDPADFFVPWIAEDCSATLRLSAYEFERLRKLGAAQILN